MRMRTLALGIFLLSTLGQTLSLAEVMTHGPGYGPMHPHHPPAHPPGNGTQLVPLANQLRLAARNLLNEVKKHVYYGDSYEKLVLTRVRTLKREAREFKQAVESFHPKSQVVRERFRDLRFAMKQVRESIQSLSGYPYLAQSYQRVTIRWNRLRQAYVGGAPVWNGQVALKLAGRLAKEIRVAYQRAGFEMHPSNYAQKNAVNRLRLLNLSMSPYCDVLEYHPYQPGYSRKEFLRVEQSFRNARLALQNAYFSQVVRQNFARVSATLGQLRGMYSSNTLGNGSHPSGPHFLD